MTFLAKILDRQTARDLCFTLLVATAALFFLSACTMPDGSTPRTSGELKEFIQQPGPLLVLMLAAALASAFKQVVVARRGDPTRDVGVVAYFIDNWPETLISLGTTVGLWLTLLMTDSLNWAAIAWGYIANDAADAFTTRGRSELLVSTNPTPPK
jgi:hypothetical protein